MAHVIVGIHGLSSKPPHEGLRESWLNAINEGLRKNCKIESPAFEFKLVRWAGTLHEPPVTDETEPYRRYPEDRLPWGDRGVDDRLRQYAVRKGSDIALKLAPIRWLRRWALARRELNDLKQYYNENAVSRIPIDDKTNLREVIQEMLRRKLLEHRGDRIMVIAHSMGSIVAYDVLRDLGRSESPMEVGDLATIGSPLGFDLVRKKVSGERDYSSYSDLRLRTPTVVTQRWGNYADAGDRTSINWDLAKFYGPNERSVRTEDKIVYNSYVRPDGKRNRHKSYGYLRTPELSAHIRNFLSRA